jgi:KDO2-lipid IV(A) lauroyltransferase
VKLIEKRDLVFLAYWAVIQLLRLFPPTTRLKVALSVSRLCARLWLWLSPSETRQTLSNLKLMLAEHDQADERDLKQINFEHHVAHVWAMLVPDILPYLTKDQIRQLGEVRGMEHLEAALAQGRGAVLISAHFGSHGYLIVALLAAYGCPVTAVSGLESTQVGSEEPDGSWLYRKLVHPVRMAPRPSLPFLTRGLVLDPKVFEILKRNEVLWLQGDMHLTVKQALEEKFALPVPFLWGTAAVRSGPVRLPKVTGAPVLPTFAVRHGSRLIVEIEPPLTLTPGASREALTTDLRAYLERLEARILAAPDQWAFTRHENLPHWIRTTPLPEQVAAQD